MRGSRAATDMARIYGYKSRWSLWPTKAKSPEGEDDADAVRDGLSGVAQLERNDETVVEPESGLLLRNVIRSRKAAFSRSSA